jgi:hypothetical protein
MRRGTIPWSRAAVAWTALMGAAMSAAAERPAGDDPITEPAPAANATAAAPHDLQVRYAQARLRLAELDLERAIAASAAAKDSVGSREVQRLRTHVDMLRHQVDIARSHPRTAARQAATAAAEAACTDARADLEAALRANQRTPFTVSDINVERLRAKVELAEVRLAMCKSPDYELSLLAEMEWNIEQLTDEVIDLRHRVETGAKQDAGQPR